MKSFIIPVNINIYDFDELSAADRQLITKARESTYRSYAPYSCFSVGAGALLPLLFAAESMK